MLSIIVGLTYIVVCGAAGIRLCLLWRRTRELPELLIGIAFLAAGGQVTASRLGLVLTGATYQELSGFLSVAFRVCCVTYCVATLIGVWRVFRPHELWAKLLVGLMLAQAATFALRNLIVGELPWAELVQHPIYWWDTFGQIAPYVWVTWETARFQNVLRKRRRLGLAVDPMLAHRTLLWAIGKGSVAILLIHYEVLVALSIWTGWQAPAAVSQAFLFVFGITSPVCLWLAFLPPKWYLKRRLI